MGKSFKVFLVIIGFAVSYCNLHSQGYEIKVKIPALKDSTLILGHYIAKAGAFIADDTIKLNKSGVGTFKGNKKLPKGLYIILLPSKNFFELMLGANQVFSVEGDTANIYNNVKFTGSLDNSLLYEYRTLINTRSKQANQLFERKKAAKTSTQKDSITKAIDKLNQEVVSYIANLKAKHSETYMVKFISSIEEIKVPDFPRDDKGRVLDSTFQYKYYKAHYFDNFNIGDPDLLRTPFYEQKLINFFDNMVPPFADSINLEIDKIMTRVFPNEELFRFVLGKLYTKYGTSQIMGHDGVFVHLAEKWYLPNATWADSAFKASLRKDIGKLKPNLIGNIAPNIQLIELPYDHFMVAKTDTALKRNINVGFYTSLHDIKSKYLVVVFWEADCGHCKTTIPKLHEIYEKVKDKGVQVLAIHLIASVEGKMKWVDFVNDHNLGDWHNAWSPNSIAYKELYNVYTTPVIYILDENKKILAKRIGPENIEEIIDFENKKNKLTQNK